jgi:hypothetical protein
MEQHIQPEPDPLDPRVQPPPLPHGYAGTPPAPQTPAPALPAVSFPSDPYAPDGGCPAGGLFAMLALTLLAGLVVGVLAGLIHLVFFLVLIFPILMGLAVGAAGYGAVVLGKVRSRLLAAGTGVLAGCLTIIAMHFIMYVVRGGPAAGWSFGKYIDENARFGVRINSTRGGGPKDKGMNLGYVGSYIYWFVEMAIVAGIAGAMMGSRAGKPFCRACGSWKTQHNLGVLFLPRADATDYFEAGELSRLVDPQNPQGEGPISLSVWWCPYCLDAAPVDASLAQTVQQKKNVKVTQLGTRTFPGEALPVFRALCTHRGDPTIPPAIR